MKALERLREGMVRFIGGFNTKTADITGSRKDSAFRNDQSSYPSR